MQRRKQASTFQFKDTYIYSTIVKQPVLTVLYIGRLFIHCHFFTADTVGIPKFLKF
jgi:hypothetical protein